jgi:Tfp pilus assembly protein PilX
MTPINFSSKNKQQGFALLITLLTVGVVVSATIAIVELSRLQLQLSVDSRDAEIAFSAANAAKECGQYIRAVASTTIAAGSATQFNCFDTTRNVSNIAGITNSGGGTVRRYQAVMDWGTGDRCSVVDIIAVYSLDTADTVIGGGGNSSLRRIVSNYRSDTLTCPAGAECTIIAGSGFNAPCANRNQLGVLKREVLLEL